MVMHRKFITVRAVGMIFAATFISGGKAAADQVFPDDVMVQGSLCVGFDCVNNENFGIR